MSNTCFYTFGSEKDCKNIKKDSFQTIPQINISFIGENGQPLVNNTIQEDRYFTMIVTINQEVSDGLLKLRHYFSGSSTLNVDYISLGPIIFKPGGPLRIEKKISVLNDNELEGNETLIINISDEALSGYTLVGSKSYTFTIRDTEVFQINVVNGNSVTNEGDVLNIYAELQAVNEQGEKISVSDGYIIPFTVELMIPTQTSPGTSSMNIAEPNQDIYVTKPMYIFDQKTIDQKRIPIQVFLYDDNILELDEEIIIMFKSVCTSSQKIQECLPNSNYKGNVINALFGDSHLTQTSLTLIVQDNENAKLQLKEVIYGIESNTNPISAELVFQLDKKNGVNAPIPFHLNMTNGNAIGALVSGNGADYNNQSISTSFSGYKNEAKVSIQIFDDNGSEGTEFFYAQVDNFDDRRISITLEEKLKNRVMIKILDDDKPTINMFLENGGNESLKISPSIKFEYLNSSKVVSEDVKILLEYSGTAKLDADYTITSSEVTVKSNVSVTRLGIPLLIDDIIEGIEYIEVQATIIGNTVAMGNDYLNIQIQDKNYPNVRLLQTTEGKEGLVNAKFTLGLSNENNLNVTSELPYDIKVPFKIKNSQADIGNDVKNSPLVVTIKSGALNGTFEFEVIDDDVYEQVEIMDIEIIDGYLYDIYDNQMLELSIGITDNEVLPSVSIDFQGRAISEDNGSAMIRVRVTDSSNRTMRNEMPISLTFNFTGQAVRNNDYLFPEGITINPYTTEKNLILQAQVDSDTEGNETVVIAIDKITNGVINPNNNTVNINILEGENLPIISLISLDNSSIPEQNGTATLLLVFPSLSNQDREIVLELAGSAVKNVDYNISEERLTIPSGSVSKRVNINTINDEIYEENDFIRIGVKDMNYGQPIIIQINDDDLNPNLVTITTDKKYAIADGSDIVNVYVRLTDVGGNAIKNRYNVYYKIPDITTDNELMNFDASTGLYSSSVTTNNPGVYSISIIINNINIASKEKITFEYERILPNEILTPNDDNINEFWYIKGIDLYLNNSVFIYDVKGNLVWKTNAYNNKDNYWSGEANVFSHQSIKKLKEGTYFYRLIIPSIPIDKKGVIELLR